MVLISVINRCSFDLEPASVVSAVLRTGLAVNFLDSPAERKTADSIEKRDLSGLPDLGAPLKLDVTPQER